jgi:hypothetical protein
MRAVTITVIVAIALVLVVVGLNLVMKRKGFSIPGRTVVRCGKGHLFTTVWIEGGSLKAVRLGPTTRFQYCPVGKHFAIVHPVKDSELTDEGRRMAKGDDA